MRMYTTYVQAVVINEGGGRRDIVSRHRCGNRSKQVVVKHTLACQSVHHTYMYCHCCDDKPRLPLVHPTKKAAPFRLPKFEVRRLFDKHAGTKLSLLHMYLRYR